jgi:ribose/xylose/arabinose/galactoside ABC-type transport system permease subunit
MTNILNLAGVATYYQMLMKGGILIMAATAQEVKW